MVRVRKALAVAAVIVSGWLAVLAPAAAAQDGPVPGTTTPPPTPGERLQVLGETITRDGAAEADDTLTWVIAAAVAAATAAAVAGASKGPGHRRRSV